MQQADPQGLAGIDKYFVVEFIAAWFPKSARRENQPSLRAVGPTGRKPGFLKTKKNNGLR
jgi:hypothetical protein